MHGFTSAQNPQQTETGTVAALVVSAASQGPCIGSSPHCTWSDPFIGAEKKAYYYTSIGAKKGAIFPDPVSSSLVNSNPTTPYLGKL